MAGPIPTRRDVAAASVRAFLKRVCQGRVVCQARVLGGRGSAPLLTPPNGYPVLTSSVPHTQATVRAPPVHPRV